jgi:hypothetical protein
MQDQLDITKPVQQAGMDRVHDVREIQCAIDAFGPAAIATEELPRARVPHHSFHRLFEIHASKFTYNLLNPNRVYP